MAVESHKETLGFQTEVRQLLDLMIHSLYSNKEIFLRELISNASDAADRLRFEALTDDALYEGDADLSVRARYDKNARTITVADNGIGMSRAEVIDQIGTIAKSGTRAFISALTGDQAKDTRLIGQFGVGFYSVFLVAAKVTLVTRRAGLGAEHGVRFESDGKGEFSIETVECPKRGTEVTLHLRDGEDEFLNATRLRSIVRKYSDHIAIPIVMPAADEKGADETVNRASALWVRPRKEISATEYDEFYKHTAHDFEPPLAYTHSRVEGKQEYILLLYVPGRAPFDLWDRDRRHGVKLYVRRVFIMDDADRLLPSYLRFMRGVIDSSDLPLNVSREILQHNKDIDAIRAGAVRKTLDLLSDLASNHKDKYVTFWSEFGRVLKEGVIEDHGNSSVIAPLLRFASTKAGTERQEVSFADYVARMKPEQKQIYFLSADSYAAAKHSPHLEIFTRKDIEVLLLYDRIDEWVTTHLTEFEGKPLVSVAKGDLDLGALADQKEKEQQTRAETEFQDLVGRIKQALGEQVKTVRITHRLTDSPACLVIDADGISMSLGRLLKAAGQSVPPSRPILEINPNHPVVRRLKTEPDGLQFNDWGRLLYDQALLCEGGVLEDPAGFVKRLNELLVTLAGTKH